MNRRSRMQWIRQSRWTWLLGALAISVAVGSMSTTAKGATLTDCVAGEIVRMFDPVVTVIEGPGDAAEEQARLSALEFSRLYGSTEIALGETTFNLERVP